MGTEIKKEVKQVKMEFEFNFVCDNCDENEQIDFTYEGKHKMSVKEAIERATNMMEGEWVIGTSDPIICDTCHEKEEFIRREENAKKLLKKLFNTEEGDKYLEDAEWLEDKAELKDNMDEVVDADSWAFDLWYKGGVRESIEKFREIVDEEFEKREE